MTIAPVDIEKAMIEVLPVRVNPPSNAMTRRDLNQAVVENLEVNDADSGCVKLRVGNILALYRKKRENNEPAAIHIVEGLIEYWVKSSERDSTVDEGELNRLPSCG